MKIITDKFLSAVVLTAAALCTSCSTDNLTAEQQQGQNETKAVSLTATMDEAVTRAGMQKVESKALFYWHKGDQILVQTSKTDNTISGEKFYTADATGATTATFWSEPLSGETIGAYALYPYNEKHQFTSNTELTYNLPATYTYTTVGTDIFSNTTDGATTYPTNSTNIPLLGTVGDENNNITFKHLGGLLVIRIDQMPFAAGTMTVSADQQLSGDFSVNPGADNCVLATTSTEKDADKQVAFTFSGAAKGGIGVFYLPVATGEYTHLTVTISDSEGANTQTIPYGTLNISSASVWAISLTAHEGSLRNVRKLENGNSIINGREFVDLGLPSGTLWATMNVGAEKATDDGNYYAWGEVTAYNEATDWGTKDVKTDYSWSTYKYGTSGSNLTKYDKDNLTTLEAEDDAAYVNWGSYCRMPTYIDVNELLNTDNCVWTWTEGDVNGYTVTSKTNGNSIFFPASGYRTHEAAYKHNTSGCYWTGSLYSSSSDCASFLNVDSYDSELSNGLRFMARPIRPVVDQRTSQQGEMTESMNSNGFFEGWE